MKCDWQSCFDDVVNDIFNVIVGSIFEHTTMWKETYQLRYFSDSCMWFFLKQLLIT